MKGLRDALTSANVDAEVSALITTLHETEQRLEELTGGEVDTVADREGRTFLMRKAQDHLRLHQSMRLAAILNALPDNIALLDSQGVIVAVNESWRRFARTNQFFGSDCGVGVSYLEVCDAARGTDSHEAAPTAEGIRRILSGEASEFSIEYPCHSPLKQRWFLMSASPLHGNPPAGVAIRHLDTTLEHEAKEDLRASERKFRQMAENIGDLFFLREADSLRMTYVSPAYERIWGRSCESLYANPESWMDPIHPDDRGLIGARNAHGRPLSRFEVELRLVQDDGSLRWVEARGFPVRNSSGHTVSVAGVVKDITERKATEARINYLNRVHAMLSGINTLILRVRDRDELFNGACRMAVEAGGFRMAMIGIVDRVANKIFPIASAGKDEEIVATISKFLSSGELASRTMVARAIRAKQSVVSNDSHNDPQVLFGDKYAEAGVRSIAILPLIVSDESTGALALYAGEIEFFHEEEMMLLTELAGDIAFAIDHIGKQEKLDYLAYYDALTGLANRSLFLERVAQYLRSADSGGHKLALCLIDLERFKNINDSLGWSAGDDLLKQVTEWLKRSTGDANLLARVGADYFGLVLPEVMQGGDVARQIERTLDAFLDHPFRLDDTVFRIAAKVGIALFPDDGSDAETLFKNAEAALKMAKRSGDRYLFHTQKMTEAVALKLALENQLRQALDNEEFVLHYQPKVNLASGKVTSAEALIRWNDPRTGLVPPAMFIPSLEETGLIYHVGRWALKKSLDDFLRWRDAGHCAVRIAVNVSPLQLRHPDFVSSIEQVLAVDAHAAQGLELEITESMIMGNVQQSIAALQAIRDMGITIAIDDFGTGFSSLAYLSRLPVDTLKIDRSFVADMTSTPQGLALVSTIIDLAHGLSLKVVAEGVETEAQSSLLKLLRCDEMQGYLFCKPVPAEIFEARFLAPPCVA